MSSFRFWRLRFASLLVAAGAMAVWPRSAAVVERRLNEIAGEHAGPAVEAPSYRRTLTDRVKRLGELVPKSASETGKLQRKLVAAGYRQHEAIWIFFGIRIGVALACFAISTVPIFFRPNLGVSLGAAGLGYLLPSMILGRQARRRQHRIRLSLPDALDLLVVSVEAGLGLDQAIQRVGDELAFAHPDLADELRLINLELRAGSARSEALHNLASRTGVDDVASLVSMLVQTDKFGTSVATYIPTAASKPSGNGAARRRLFPEGGLSTASRPLNTQLRLPLRLGTTVQAHP